MLSELVVAKLEGVNQATLLSGLAGKSYTVGQVATTGNGMGTMLFLTPDGGAAAAGQGAVALKLEGTRQMAQMSGLVGKSVTIGKAPLVAGGTGNWAAFYPKAALAGKGLAGAGAAGLGGAGLGGAGLGAAAAANTQLIMMKLEGATAAQAPLLSGKTFTVIKSTAAAGEPGKWLFLQPVGGAATKDIVVLKVQHAAAQLPMLVGNTFTFEQGPIIAADNASKYVFLKPAAGLTGKSLAGTAAAAKGAAAAGLVDGGASGFTPAMKVVALKTIGTGTGTSGTATLTAGKTLATSAATKGTAAAKTIWAGTGLSLGLGCGLGAAGPIILGGLIAAAGYGVYHYRKKIGLVGVDSDEDISEALS
ncbi:MAG: magnetosome protein MamD [Rhodospirillaceae bacterium]